jgi:hypothetical protein
MNRTSQFDATPEAWAAEQLGTSADASAEQAKVAFMQRLQRADFSASEAWAQALGVFDPDRVPFADLTGDVDREIERNRVNEGRAAVEEFASRYWDYPPQERREQWESLYERYSEYRALADRLDQLARGLAIPKVELGDQPGKARGVVAKKVHVLRENLIEWFPLAPAIRAAQRRNWLIGINRNDLWESAARELAQNYPHYAALDPELVSFLTTTSGRKQDVRAAVKQRQKVVARASTTSNSDGSGSKGFLHLGWLVFLVLYFVVKGCSASKRSTPNFDTNPTGRPSYYQDKTNWNQFDNRYKTSPPSGTFSGGGQYGSQNQGSGNLGQGAPRP